MSMIQDIKSYLTDKGIDETIYLGNMPDAPDCAVCLYEDEGQEDIAYTELKRLGLSVLCRCGTGDYEMGYGLLESVHSILNEVGNEMLDKGEAVEINSKLYFRILANGSGCIFDKDERGRITFRRGYIVVRN